MPSETLQLHYPAIPRVNRRRPKPRTLAQTITRLVLLLVGLVILIVVLSKLGFFQEPERPVYVASCMTQLPTPPFSPLAFPSTLDARLSGLPTPPVLAFSL